MYRQFYGLQHRPFELAPDGNVVYLSEAHREAIATLRYGVIAQKGFLLLTGGVGAGKTTILNNVLGTLKDEIRLCVLNNPTLNKNEFFYYLEDKLGITSKGNKAKFILQFSKLLNRCETLGEKILLIIDEAQIFPINLLEEIRLLSNLAGDRNVLSIFLIGQPELQEKLAHPQLLPLRQRIGIRYHLEPLNRDDTSQYIVYRLHKAEANNPAIFTRQAIDCIHEASQGNPRLINIICDHAMISGFTQDMIQIDQDVIRDCLQDIRLQGEDRLQISEAQGQTQNGASEPSKKKRYVQFSFFLLLVLLAASGVYYFFFVLQGRLPNF